MNCYILCGGKSSRIGRPKQGLEIGGRAFLDRVHSAAAEVFDKVVAVTKAGLDAGGIAVIREQDTSQTAPILGLERAAADAGDAAFFALAVDYPLVTADLLAFLRERFEGSAADIVAPRYAGKVHVLCAGYRAPVHASLVDKILRGDFRLQGLLDLHRSEIIEQEEVARFGDALLNVNTLEDLEKARARHAEEIEA